MRRYSHYAGGAVAHDRFDHDRLMRGTYRIRTIVLLLLALSSVFVGAPLVALAVVSVAVPFNIIATKWHRKHGRPAPWFCADMVIAAGMTMIDPAVLAGTVISLLANAGVGTLANGKRSVQRASTAASVVVAASGLAHRTAAPVAFVVPLLCCCLAVSRVVDYLQSKERAHTSRYEDLLDGIQAAVFEVDLDSNVILYANRHSVDLVGSRLTDGAQLLALVHPDDRQHIEGQMAAAVVANEPVRLEVRAQIDGASRYFELQTSLSRKGDKARIRLVLIDVSDRKHIELEMAYRALHDALTDLPNRSMISQRMDLHTRGAEEERQSHAVLMLDLDSFKHVNDGLGHHHGDLLLVEIAERLRRTVRPIDLIARMGGDEFAIWLECCDEAHAVEVAERVGHNIAAPYVVDGITIDPAVSIGIALFPRDATDASELLRLADIAMYRAKRSGSGHALYGEESDVIEGDRLRFQAEFRDALVNGQLEAHFQPVINSVTGRIASCEALVRWRHPSRGLLVPASFWGTVESSGLASDVSRFMLGQAFERLREWLADGVAVPVAVNLSAEDFHDPGVIDFIRREIGADGGLRGLLTIELTETDLIKKTQGVSDAMAALRELGVSTAVDDFGTGYSSLAWLRDLPIGTVKIDRSFVENLCSDGRTHAIVRSTIELAHELDLVTIAEGVEDGDTAAALTTLGCDYLQGYLFGPPVAPDEIRRLLTAGLDLHQL